ncbi:hypothetical protein [Porphyromonas sp.]
MNTKKWASALLLAGLTLGLASCGKKKANEEPEPTHEPTPTHVYTITKVEVSPKEVVLEGEVGRTNLEEINFGDAVLGTGKFTEVTLDDNTITFTGTKAGAKFQAKVKGGGIILLPKYGKMPIEPELGKFEVTGDKISGTLKLEKYNMFLLLANLKNQLISEELTKVLTALGKANTSSTITFEGTLKK